MPPRTTLRELTGALARLPGLIPVDLDADRHTLLWQDLGAFHCYEGFFTASLRTFAGLMRARHGDSSTVRFETDLDVLDSDEVLTDCIWPTGFILHAARCGSTALARSLARPRAHVVFGEANAHNSIWRLALDPSALPIGLNQPARERYRRLLLAMGRRRGRSSRAHFVKFTSFNILFLRCIRSAFPDVPAVFLYREPRQILASLRGRPAGWGRPASPFAAFIGGVGSVACSPGGDAYYDHALKRFFEAALLAGGDSIRYVDYRYLTSEHLPAVLDALGVRSGPDDVALMQAELRYDAKATFSSREFRRPSEGESPNAEDAGGEVSVETRELYQRLVASDLNIVSRKDR